VTRFGGQIPADRYAAFTVNAPTAPVATALANLGSGSRLHRLLWPRGLSADDSTCWVKPSQQTVVWWILVGFAALDFLHPIAVLHEVWWLVFLVLWAVPWQQPAQTVSTFTNAIRMLSSLWFFSWLILRTLNAVLIAISTWSVFTGFWATLFSFALRNTFASVITASLIVVPLGRVSGRHSQLVAMLATLYTGSLLALPAVFTVSEWVSHPVPTAVSLYDAVILLLVMGEAVAIREHRRLRNHVNDGRHGVSIYSSAFLAGRLNAGAALVLFGALAWSGVACGFWIYNTGVYHLHGYPLHTAARATTFPMVLFMAAFAAVASWRSLVRRSDRTVIANRLAIVGRTVVCGTCLVLFLYTVFFAPVGANVFSESVQNIVGTPWSITPEPHTLRLRGELLSGVSDALARVLSDNPSVLRLELNSPGGQTVEGLALARLVEQHSLSTVVRHKCASACTDIFVAGKERVLVSGGKLGFHRTQGSTWDPTSNEESNAEMARHYRTHGIREDFIQKVLKVPADDIWYPSAEELLDAGVITAFR
jgi:hypothetical protein